MTPSKNGAWTKSKSTETLTGLREEYPRYTDNELYAIWCNENGLIPLDADDKLDLDQWRMHASHDGQHIQEGGFKVSRALYGRALNAKSGVAKPRQKRRTRSEAPDPAAHAGELRKTVGLSSRALKLAKEHDRGAAVLKEALARQAEAIALLSQLRGMEPCIAFELSRENTEARELLERAGVLAAPDGTTGASQA